MADTTDNQADDIAQVLTDALRSGRRTTPDHLRKGLSEDDDDA